MTSGTPHRPRARVIGVWEPVRVVVIRHWPILVLLAIAMPYLWTVTLLHTQAMSATDEWPYIDYISKIYSQGFVHEGETYGQHALWLMSCHGIIPNGRFGVPCGAPLTDPSVFPYLGLNYAASYTPVQFAVTRVVGDGIGLLPGVSQLAGWRLVGSLWFAAGLIVTYAIARRFRIAPAAFIVAGLVMTASPSTWWAFTFISTDGPMFFFGALVLLVTIRFSRGEASGWWIVLVAGVGATFKVTNVLALGVAFLYLGIRFILRARDGRRPPWSHLWTPVVAIVLALAVQFIWLRLVPLFAVSDLRADHGIAAPLQLRDLLPQFMNFIQYTLGTGMDELPIRTDLYLPLQAFSIAAIIGALLLYRQASRDRALTLAVAIAFVVAAPFMAITFQLSTGAYFALPSRYGIVLLPGLLLLGMQILRNRAAIWAIGLYAGMLLIFGVSVALDLRAAFP